MELIDLEELGLMWVHRHELCEGRGCCIHHPSHHPMVTWPRNWRSDRRMMERLCSHGIGHPDPDDLDFINSLPGRHDDGTHCCDGCCSFKVKMGLNET